MQHLSLEHVRRLKVDDANPELRAFARLEYGRESSAWWFGPLDRDEGGGLRETARAWREVLGTLRARLAGLRARLGGRVDPARDGSAEPLGHVGPAPPVSVLPVVLAHADAAGDEEGGEPRRAGLLLRRRQEPAAETAVLHAHDGACC
jgi:hypothetical protein